MAGAAPAKKRQIGEFQARHGIWLNDAGSLSFGKGSEGELLITESDYAELKAKSTEERIQRFKDINNPPPPPVETPVPAEVVEKGIEEATAPAAAESIEG